MADQIWSWALTIVGATCFFLAGGLGTRKVWWAWYIGLFAQVLWLTYSLLDLEHRLGFLVGVALYGFVYVRNCVKWTREHFAGRAGSHEVVARASAMEAPEDVRHSFFLPMTKVQLLQFDRTLLEQHGVIPRETIGVIARWSHLGPDDFGVLVNWGDGREVRCDVQELRAVTP